MKNQFIKQLGIEKKYARGVSRINLGIFIALLTLEAITTSYAVYKNTENIFYSAIGGITPVLITISASAYIAQKYEIPKHKKLLIEEYEQKLKDFLISSIIPK
ncbi:MAG: hypothetical protein QNJ47_10470 [Nostocaceae cyanobacterium]|nr:hypothetical protein [Nostocaceae cyanobacterium]